MSKFLAWCRSPNKRKRTATMMVREAVGTHTRLGEVSAAAEWIERRGTPMRTAAPSRSPIALRGVSIGALSEPSGASQVRCAPVILPVRSVTAAIMAGHVSVGPSSGL